MGLIEIADPKTLKDLKDTDVSDYEKSQIIVEMIKVPPKIRLLKRSIVLNPTISKTNFYSFVSLTLVLGLILVPVNLIHQPLLEVNYRLTLNQQKDLTAFLSFMHLVFKVAFAPVLGYLFDR